MAKVVVGMSGGVDSAVAALLLKEAGYDVIGVTLRTWVSSDGGEGRCCEIDDARSAARTIGIPYHVFNCVSDFETKVIKPFTEDYLNGLTPNPCVICNREIKWERLLYHADVLGADYVATGHYAYVARLDNGRYTVRKALHGEKDQTYMLYRLTQEQLARTLMPLGDYSKQEVRDIAERAGLTVASKPDSQEICCVTDGDYADFLEKVGWASEKKPGGSESANIKVSNIDVKTDAPTSAPRAKEDRKARADYIAERSKVIKPLEKQLAKLEEDIAKAEALGGELEAKLVTASESGDGNAITAIAKDMDDNKKKVDQLYEDWEKVSAELEAAKDKWKL